MALPIYLLGLRGSGKSTLGRSLATRLRVLFVDLDDVTASLLKCVTPAEALNTHGQAAFRAAELKALSSPGVMRAKVVALGGGTPTAPGAPDALRKSKATLVYLRATPETLRARLAATDLASRPSLSGADVLTEIDAVFERRDPIYLALADEVVEVDGKDEGAILAALVEMVTRP
ncbi:MAG: shikimate kinase [Phycisphaerales bacterium]|nr:shikimate kinase [Phycisphaerales bacterium]